VSAVKAVLAGGFTDTDVGRAKAQAALAVLESSAAQRAASFAASARSATAPKTTEEVAQAIMAVTPAQVSKAKLARVCVCACSCLPSPSLCIDRCVSHPFPPRRSSHCIEAARFARTLMSSSTPTPARHHNYPSQVKAFAAKVGKSAPVSVATGNVDGVPFADEMGL
jgi:hypothetical protein